MKPNKEGVVKQLNPLFNNQSHAPTITERDAGKDFIRIDLDEEQFNILLFKVANKKVKRSRNGHVMFQNEGGGDGDDGKKEPCMNMYHVMSKRCG